MKSVFRFLTRVILVLTAAAALLFIWGYCIEPHRIRVETASVGTAAELPANARGVRICAFSDTHLGFGYDAAMLEEAAETIDAQDPDLIVFLGDLYDDYGKLSPDTRQEDEVIAVLSLLSAPAGKYAVLGNHDYAGNVQRDIDRILTAAGFTVLYDEAVELPMYGLCVYGARDRIYGGADPAAYTPKAGYYNVVLSHEPDVFDEMKGVDLMLSGHTHGGQIRVPFVGTLVDSTYGRRYTSGLYSDSRGQIYVTRGLGMTILKLRFLCPPEISVLNIGGK